MAGNQNSGRKKHPKKSPFIQYRTSGTIRKPTWLRWLKEYMNEYNLDPGKAINALAMQKLKEYGASTDLKK